MSTGTKKTTVWAIGLPIAVTFLGVFLYILIAGGEEKKVEKTSGSQPQKEHVLVKEYDLDVPAKGCSKIVDNTDPNLWVKPTPKNPEVGYPKNIYIVRQDQPLISWVEYEPGDSYSYIRFCDNEFAMQMHIEFYRGQL